MARGQSGETVITSRRALKPVTEALNISWSTVPSAREVLEAVRNLNPHSLILGIKQKFENDLRARMEEGAARRGKLFFLFQMQPEAGRAAYLDYLPQYLATSILRLLTSGHHLRIETGRWNQTPQESRLCIECEELETEEHALFSRTRHNGLRLDQNAHLQFPGSPKLTEFTRFCLNRSVKDTGTENLFFYLANYVRKILKSAYLSYKASATIPPVVTPQG